MAVSITLFTAGALIGPYAAAVVTGWSDWRNPDPPVDAAHALLRELDIVEQTPVRMAHRETRTEECGYRLSDLFGESPALIEGEGWSPYSGYFDLELAEGAAFDREANLARARAVAQLSNTFHVGFLRQCLRGAPFKSPCVAYTRAMLSLAGIPDTQSLPSGTSRPNTSRQQRTRCVYLDGIAARRGLPLAQR